MAFAKYRWIRQTIAQTLKRIRQAPQEPWVAIGDFLDDWRRSELVDRQELIEEPILLIHDDSQEIRQWAAFCAAAVEWLCWQDGISFPNWTSQKEFWLSQPWQIATTPTPFRMRNIFGGDCMLDRV